MFSASSCAASTKGSQLTPPILLMTSEVALANATTTISTSEANGIGEAPYSWGVDKDEIRKAEIEALINALESWVVSNHKSHYKNYKNVKEEIDKDISAYILRYDTIDTEQNKDSKTIRVTLRAKINEVKLLDKLVGECIGECGLNYITFVFVARELAGTVSYSEQVSTISNDQVNSIEKQRSGGQSSLGVIQKQSIANSRAKKEFTDKVIWRVATTNAVDVAMGDVFTNADFSVIDAGLLEEETGYLLDVNNFIKDYERGNDLTSATKRDALKGLKSLDDPVQYLAIGTLDIDKTLVDNVTGNFKVPVSVTAQILAVQRRGSAVAKVGPVQYFGMGPTVIVARNNALKLAAEEVATNLVAKLSSKNIR